MLTEGWIFMIGSWLIISVLFAYSMIRTITSKESGSDDTTDRE